jgi:hypothetical protein
MFSIQQVSRLHSVQISPEPGDSKKATFSSAYNDLSSQYPLNFFFYPHVQPVFFTGTTCCALAAGAHTHHLSRYTILTELLYQPPPVALSTSPSVKPSCGA